AEVMALKTSGQHFGLIKHTHYAQLEPLLDEFVFTLKSPQAQNDFAFANAIWWLSIFGSIVAVVLSLGACLFWSNENHSTEINDYFTNTIGGIFCGGIVLSVVFYCNKWVFKTGTQKRLGSIAKRMSKVLRDVRVSGYDIVVSRMKIDDAPVY